MPFWYDIHNGALPSGAERRVEAKKSPKPVSNICFVGAGYVGGTTAAVMAKECPNLQITVVDTNAERTKSWQSNDLPVSEAGLLPIVKIAREKRKNLHFTTAMEESIQQADIIMVSVDTPTKAVGTGSGFSLDTSRLEDVIMSIARFSKGDKIVVEKSTVPVGTGQTIREILNNNASDGITFEVLSNPEFLAEGTAVQNLISPDRIIVGSMDTESGLLATEVLVDIYANWVPRSRIITMNLFSSELSKLAANCILAQRVSSINALSAMCEVTGANIEQVAQAVGTDSRVGPHMLRPSFGFGGSCFKKDIRSLVYLCRFLHLDEVAAYWESILNINEKQKSRSVARIVSRFNNNMSRKKVAVLGFAFKEGTGDTRESCAIDLVKGFLHEGASVSIYDPCVQESQIYRDLGNDLAANDCLDPLLKVSASGEEACDGAHVVLVATNWDMFRVKIKVPTKDSATINDVSFAASENSFGPLGLPKHDGDNPEKADSGYASSDEETTNSTSTTQPKQDNETSHGDIRGSSNMDWTRIARVMKYPRIVFGSSVCLHTATLEEMGFSVEIIGNKPKTRQS